MCLFLLTSIGVFFALSPREREQGTLWLKRIDALGRGIALKFVTSGRFVDGRRVVLVVFYAFVFISVVVLLV